MIMLGQKQCMGCGNWHNAGPGLSNECPSCPPGNPQPEKSEQVVDPADTPSKTEA